MFSFSANDESKTKICFAFEPFYIELAWENNREQPSDISRPHHWFPHETRLGNDCRKSIDDVSPTQVWKALLIGRLGR